MVQGLLRSRSIRLTPAEIKVLSLIAEGMTSKEVAEKLFLSKRTIDFHLANIYDKLQVNNRIQALREAGRYGLIPSVPVLTTA
jgi:DNA-binding CsgD family transcriptional regulator